MFITITKIEDNSKNKSRLVKRANNKVNTMDKLLDIITAEKLFMYFLQYSDIFEDNIEAVIKQAYKDNLRCTQIDINKCKEYGLFDNLDYNHIFTIIEKQCKINLSMNCKNEIKEFVQTSKFFPYIYDCIQDWYRMVISDMNLSEDADITDVHQLDDISDKKGDIYTAGKGFSIDAPVRDYPFIYYNGSWYNWDDEQSCNSHSEIIDKYFGEGIARSNNLRDVENIPVLEADKPIIFGDTIGNIGFIEGYQNLSEDEAISICKTKFQKVYEYRQTENKVTRLGKKL